MRPRMSGVNKQRGVLMGWDWQVFCQDTITQEVGASCFGQGGDITYLDWMLSAWDGFRVGVLCCL